MGGSGGGGGSTRRRREAFDCMELAFETVLERVDDPPAHEEFTVLEIVREKTEGGSRIVAIDDDGDAVGVVRENTGALNGCIEGGIAFVASVINENRGVYQVAVRAAFIRLAIGDYEIQEPGGFGSDPVEMSDPSDLPGDVVVGLNVLARSNICELRALARAEVELVGEVVTSEVATVRSP